MAIEEIEEIFSKIFNHGKFDQGKFSMTKICQLLSISEISVNLSISVIFHQSLESIENVPTRVLSPSYFTEN